MFGLSRRSCFGSTTTNPKATRSFLIFSAYLSFRDLQTGFAIHPNRVSREKSSVVTCSRPTADYSFMPEPAPCRPHVIWGGGPTQNVNPGRESSAPFVREYPKKVPCCRPSRYKR